MMQIVGVLLILLLNLVFYRKAVYYKLVIDDLILVKFAPFNVKRSKITSIFIHAVVAEFIFMAFGFSYVSFIAALLFSIHPLAIQVPVWWCGRDYGLKALCVLSAIAFAPIGGVCYFFNRAGTVTALFTPFIFLFTPHWYLVFIFPILLLTEWKAIKFAIKSRKEGQAVLRYVTPEDFKVHVFRWENLILVAKTFGYYSLASLLPVKNGFYNGFLVTIGSSQKITDYWYSMNKHFWGGLLAMAIMATVWAFNIHNYIGMGILLFVFSIGPYLNFFTIQQWTAPRYAYLALAGFQIALVGLLMQLGVPGYCILSALALFYIDRTIKVMQIYKKDNITCITEDSYVYPDNPRLWYYRYEHMLHKGNPIMAYAEAMRGLQYNPEDSQLYFGLACACFTLGYIKDASGFLDLAEKYMIITERKNMEGMIAEFRARIKEVANGNVPAVPKKV